MNLWMEQEMYMHVGDVQERATEWGQQDKPILRELRLRFEEEWEKKSYIADGDWCFWEDTFQLALQMLGVWAVWEYMRNKSQSVDGDWVHMFKWEMHSLVRETLVSKWTKKRHEFGDNTRSDVSGETWLGRDYSNRPYKAVCNQSRKAVVATMVR